MKTEKIYVEIWFALMFKSKKLLKMFFFQHCIIENSYSTIFYWKGGGGWNFKNITPLGCRLAFTQKKYLTLTIQKS